MWSSTRRWTCRDGGDGGGGDGGGGGRHVVGHVEMVVMEVVVDTSLDVSTWWCVWRWWSSTRRWTCRHGGIGGGGVDTSLDVSRWWCQVVVVAESIAAY